jgi:glycosyltransferase involved in cell wall biosynthesis
MKKIVVLGPDNNIRVTRWIEFLLKEGWEVALIYSSRKNETFRHPSFSSYNMGLNFIKRSKNSKIIQNHNSEKFSWTDVSKKTNLNDLKSDMNSLTLSLIYGFKIYHLIKRIRPDAILVQGSGSIMSTFGYLLRSRFSIKKPTPLFFVIWGRSIRTKIFFWIEKYVLQSSTKIMANKTLKEIYVKHYGISANKFIINDWGINLKRNYPATDKEISKIEEKYGISNSDTILFHNRLFTAQYNIEDFFDIIPQCVNFIPNLKLLLVRGIDENTSYIDFILKEFEDKGLAKYIHYIPQKIPYDEMRILYGLSFAVASPIEHDGFCASIMEAMACGGIPILYAIESYTEKMENDINALFAPIGNTEAFAKKIVYLYQNPELRDRILKNNFELVKKIGDENINFGKVAYEMEKYIKN